MSIRLRTVDGIRVALCAARSMPKPGDLNLDDADHAALNIKFRADHASEDGLPIYACREQILSEMEESGNQNREWWDRQFLLPEEAGIPE